MEDNLEIFNTIDETPNLTYEFKTPKKKDKKNLKYNKNNNINQQNININPNKNINNNDNDNNNDININKNIEYEDLILHQRENRKIISEIKKVISNKENNDINMKKLKIKNILNNYKRNISFIYDDKRNTLLHLYTQKNDINSLEIITKVYLDILHSSNNFYKFLLLKNIDNKSVFDLSIQYNYISIVKFLFLQIEKEKNIKIKRTYMNYFKDNIFHICAEYNRPYLIVFFYEKLKKFYKYFIIDQIVNTNYKDQMNPLHIACNKGYKKVLNLLIDLGADVNSMDVNKYTPLHHAVYSGNEKLAKILLLRGANKFIKDCNNKTPYDLALSLNNKNLINLLHHKNFCQKILYGNEIGPLNKKKNHIFLLISIIFTIIFKLIIIFRFFCVFNNITFNFFFNKSLSFFENNDNFGLIQNIMYNDYINNTCTNELVLNNFFDCIDEECNFELIIFFITLTIDCFLLSVIIIFKCSNNIFLEKKSEREVESLSMLYENNDSICVKCRIPIDDSTKHCLICNRCIKNWDHHCYWLNSCINDHNYGKFKLFLFSVLLFLISSFLFYVDLLYLFFNLKDLFMEKIFNLTNETIFCLIIKIIYIILNIYMVIIILYSLIFITIPLIKIFFFSSTDDDDIDDIKSELFINIIKDDIINTEDNKIVD